MQPYSTGRIVLVRIPGRSLPLPAIVCEVYSPNSARLAIQGAIEEDAALLKVPLAADSCVAAVDSVMLRDPSEEIGENEVYAYWPPRVSEDPAELTSEPAPSDPPSEPVANTNEPVTAGA